MKGYCPHCDRYMAAVREKGKPTYFTCHPCNGRLWLGLPANYEAPIARPANSLVIFEATADDVLVIVPKEEWDSGTQLLTVIACLWTLITSIINFSAMSNDLSYNWIFNALNIFTLAFWYHWASRLYQYHLLYFDREEVHHESIVGRKRRFKRLPFTEFVGVTLDTSEFDSNSISGVRIRMRSGRNFAFTSHLSQTEMRWLAQALRRTPLLRSKVEAGAQAT